MAALKAGLFNLGWMVAMAKADNGLVEWAVMKKRGPKNIRQTVTHDPTKAPEEGGVTPKMGESLGH